MQYSKFEVFRQLLAQRKDLLEEHWGTDLVTEELLEKDRKWYRQTVHPVDAKIIILANKIMKEEIKENVVFFNINEVYASRSMVYWYRKCKAKSVATEEEIDK